MNRDSLRQLRFDRRLVGRRGWVSKEELQRELDALPDVSQKIAPSETEAGAASESSEAASESGAAPAADAPRAE